jgi:hypothetical protein
MQSIVRAFMEQLPMGDIMTTITEHAIVIRRVADADAWCDLMGRRVAAAFAVLVFCACYLSGLAHFGLLLGVAVGWLPCGIAAWLAALAVAPSTAALLRLSVANGKVQTEDRI